MVSLVPIIVTIGANHIIGDIDTSALTHIVPATIVKLPGHVTTGQ